MKSKSIIPTVFLVFFLIGSVFAPDGEFPGDANCDGVVNVLDVSIIMNYFLTLEPDPFCFENADVNGDGVINVQDIILTVNIFLGGDPEQGTVTDIDGNVYQTVIIGNQEWMAENLRVTRYNNEDDIPTGLSNTEWSNTTSGAYAIYNNDDNMLEAYGKLYNWYAVDDERGLCPEGWSVPSDADWTALVNYVVSQGFPNSNVTNGAGNALKSCRQVNSPLGGDCNTSVHPRWNSHSTHYGFDEFGFSALPGGARQPSGTFLLIGQSGYWWTSSENSSTNAYVRNIYYAGGTVNSSYNHQKTHGFIVRCLRNETTPPPTYNLNLDVSPADAGTVTGAGQYQAGELVNITAEANTGWEFVNWTDDDGIVSEAANFTYTMPAADVTLTANFEADTSTWQPCPDMPTVTDIEGNVYNTVLIGNQCWMKENLKTTKYSNGTPIEYPGSNNTAWENNTTGAYAWYNNDIAYKNTYGALYNWHAVNNSAGLCPAGWHVPTDSEWTALTTYVSSQPEYLCNNNPNWIAKSLAATTNWGSDTNTCAVGNNLSANNATGFTGLPGGYRYTHGSFISAGYNSYWWSSSHDDSSYVWYRDMYYTSALVYHSSYHKSLGFSVRCINSETTPPPTYNLNLDVFPANAGTVTGEGQYQAGEQVNITAEANTGWEFVNWTGDTEHLDNVYSAEAVVTMPANDVSLTAVFLEESNIIYGDGVTDIDGNDYITVIIGNQEWMAENLRVTRYNNGVAIPTGLSNTEWQHTTEGAYAIYPHEGGPWDDGPIEGIDSDEEMVAAYGKLYNWYAVDDTRGLCPEGWSVPSHDDWTALVNYVVSQGFPNEWNNPNGASNALKSCRQVGHPDGGDCDTSEHPRWNSHGTHFGFDEFGFSALPGGFRTTIGHYGNLGLNGRWWSSSELSATTAWGRSLSSYLGDVYRGNYDKRLGFSVRCVRDFAEEPSLYNLNLEVHPEGAGTVSGEGEYEEGELVNITATANQGWEFVNWTGDTQHLDDADSAEAIVTMPADNILLTAVFQQEDDSDIIYGDGVTDIDGNEYVTVIIGNQEWMAENLRVTRYNNEDDIPTGLSNTEWSNTTSGAYAIYNNDDNMLEAYGKLYNWYAVDDARGLCPEGWSVPSDADWTSLVNYIMDGNDYHNDWQSDDINGVGNAMKSCRQVGHPDGGDCDTSEHPRWNSHGTHSGFDEFGFSALPGGRRWSGGSFNYVGIFGIWWSATEGSGTYAWSRYVGSGYGNVHRDGYFGKSAGFSVRCFRDID